MPQPTCTCKDCSMPKNPSARALEHLRKGHITDALVMMRKCVDWPDYHIVYHLLMIQNDEFRKLIEERADVPL